MLHFVSQPHLRLHPAAFLLLRTQRRL